MNHPKEIFPNQVHCKNCENGYICYSWYNTFLNYQTCEAFKFKEKPNQ